MVDPMRDYENFKRSIRNFRGWMGDAVPGGMDIDCFIERRHQFLVIEAKPWQKGVALGYGQHLALYHLSQQPNFSVYLVGESKDRLHIAYVNEAPAPVIRKTARTTIAWWPPSRFVSGSHDSLRELVRDWWSVATASTGGGPEVRPTTPSLGDKRQGASVA